MEHGSAAGTARVADSGSPFGKVPKPPVPKVSTSVVGCECRLTKAFAKGVAVFGQEVAAGDRGRGRRRRSSAGSNGGAPAATSASPAAVPIATETMVVPRVSPLRGAEVEGTITVTIGGAPTARAAARAQLDTAPGGGPPPLDIPPQEPTEPVSGPSTPSAFDGLTPAGTDEPPLPDEASAAVASAAGARTVPVVAGPHQVLHIRFSPAPDERLVAVFEELKALIKSRPGETPIVLHIPAGPGRSQEMRLGAGIAYDAELLAECGRRFGDLLQLTLV